MHPKHWRPQSGVLPDSGTAHSLQYNSEISNTHLGEGIEVICRGRMARKNNYLIPDAPGPDAMMKSTWPKQCKKGTGHVWPCHCSQPSHGDSGRTGSCLTYTWTKLQIWLEALKSIWNTMAKCPFPALPRVAKWTLPTRLHLSSRASPPLAITEEYKSNKWGLYGLRLMGILALEPKSLSAYSERDKPDISFKVV